ncbi:HAD family hydrolase [uncultured Granulicatella sp.]|uniref:HAD family hydrolase n=1 Tax=uncultured Granulicatella sp. TaxID=316089 RepID=UPI0028D8A680|nr:HAD family hydrolase [uncultured Granulicatella sp.]
MIRLFASDMDGTILQDHSTIHPDNVKMVRYLQDKNIPFIICTGRDFYQASLCLKPENLQCPIIGLNGAIIYEEDGTILKEVTLSHEDTRALIQKIELHQNNWDMMTSNGIYSLHFEEKFAKKVETFKHNHPELTPAKLEEELIKLRQLFEAIDVSSVEEVLADPSVKIYKILTSNDEQESALLEIRSFVDTQLPNLVATSSFRTNIEVTHKDAQKGIALHHYAETLGISMEEVFTIGDNSNDVSMLKLAGYSVAMGNANQEAMATAKYQTDDNKHGGVAKAIQKCLEQQN